jgi:hypothetical protein
MLGIFTAFAVFIGYYNWRVTGNPLVLPYTIYNRTYMSAPQFRWQELPPVHEYRNPEMAAFYKSERELWLRNRSNWTWNGGRATLLQIAEGFQEFYAPLELGIPALIALFYIRANRKIRLLAVAAVIFSAALLCNVWFVAHYAAPFTAGLYVLIVMGFRYLRRWKANGRYVGVGLTRVLVLAHAGLFILKIVVVAAFLHGVTRPGDAWARERAQVKSKMESMQGQHLVLVQYSAEHDPLREWVYNAADIDNSKAVWAREIPGRDLKPLLNYFHGRIVWVVEPDAAGGPVLRPFSRTEAEDTVGADSRRSAVP